VNSASFDYQQAHTADNGLADGQTHRTRRKFDSIHFAQSILLNYSQLHYIVLCSIC